MGRQVALSNKDVPTNDFKALRLRRGSLEAGCRSRNCEPKIYRDRAHQIRRVLSMSWIAWDWDLCCEGLGLSHLSKDGVSFPDVSFQESASIALDVYQMIARGCVIVNLCDTYSRFNSSKIGPSMVLTCWTYRPWSPISFPVMWNSCGIQGPELKSVRSSGRFRLNRTWWSCLLGW
jgi:hypothetical protein